MTFNEIVSTITDRLNLTSTTAITRIGKRVNEHYRRLTVSVGMATTRRVTVSGTATIGSRDFTFNTLEKLHAVYRTESGVDILLKEIPFNEMRMRAIGSEPCTHYAIKRTNTESVTIYLDAVPTTAFTLTADGDSNVATLSGTQEPNFPESYHDILVEAVLIDEYRKLEKASLAATSQAIYTALMSELRMYIAKSAFLDVYQGKTRDLQPTYGVGGGGGSSVVTGTYQLDMEVITSKQYGALGNGVADDTVALQAAINAAAGKILQLTPGTFIVTALTGVSNVYIRGAGRGSTTIRRQAAASASDAILTFTTKTGWKVSDLTLDGNKANETVVAHNLVVQSSCSGWHIENIDSINAEGTAGTFGCGIAVINGNNVSANSFSSIRGCRCVDNMTAGIFLDRDDFIDISGNFCSNNDTSGILVSDFVFPPVAGVHNDMTVSGNICESNGEHGIMFVGYYEGGSSTDPFWGPEVPASRHITIANNHCNLNGNAVVPSGGYGIGFQGANGTLTGNTCRRNGNGMLFSCWTSTAIGNSLFDNDLAGIDAGGSRNCIVANNTFHNQGVTGASFYTDLNCGAAQYLIVQGNNFLQGGSDPISSILCNGVDGTTDADPFNFMGTSIQIDGNFIRGNGNASSLGIVLTRGFQRPVVTNNWTTNFTGSNGYILSVSNLVSFGNRDDAQYDNNDPTDTIASAATFVLPDTGESFLVTGTTQIDNIRTLSSNAFNQAVREVLITNGGSGYSQASPPTVGFVGGGGAGAAGDARISNQGLVVGVQMSAIGSGYTSAPAVTFSTGVAAGTAVVGCNNWDGREITLHFEGAVVISTAGNITLQGSLTTTANTVLRLRGRGEEWYEISRSGEFNADELVSGTVALARLSAGTATAVLSTATGAQNDWAPGLSGDTVIFWDGASALSPTGFAGGVTGQQIIFKNVTAAQIATFAHNSGSSAAANRLQNLATSAGTPVAPGGYVVYQHNGTDWKLVAHDQGAWITPTFAAGDFTANGAMTWTLASGDRETASYRLNGKTLSVMFALNTTTVGGTPNSELRIGNAQWGGFTAVSAGRVPMPLIDNGTSAIGFALLTAAATFIGCYLVNGGNWAAATDTTYVWVTITFQVT